MKKFVRWLAGFAILFAVNVFVESFVLPILGLENTFENDIYFQVWWAVVAFWLFFGWLILGRFEQSSKIK